jgi:TDG/mug DNA glycosylase family protein
MDRKTVDAYEGDDAAQRYIDRRGVYDANPAERLATTSAGWRVDVGCGPGHYTTLLGDPLVSLDASHAMLRRVRGHRVQADFAALPFRRAALGGAWASKTYQHVAHEALPLALADLHRALRLDAPVLIGVFSGDGTMVTAADDDFPGRLFSNWSPERLRAVVEGAGFVVDEISTGERRHLEVRATRARMLPDLVRPDLRVLFCGYNPSLYAADRGVPFARPGNRFWPAVLESGLLSRDRDPWHAVTHHDVGFTDMVKRASVAAAELSKDELRAGFTRITRLCEWLTPDVLCVLGIGGWRDLVNRKAIVGWQPETVGDSRVYVMPNPSGLNASTQHAGYVEHLQALRRHSSDSS